MSDFTNELLRLSEMREKGLISQEEFEAAKARLFGNSETPANENVGPLELPQAATVVMSVVPPAPPSIPPDSASPSAASKEIPPGIAGWSWGAFLWNWIWAIFNNTWIGLLALIPGVNIIMIFVLGVKGREWAWKNKQWDSVEHFNRVQRKWSVWGIGLLLAGLLLSGVLFAISMFFLASEGSKFSGFNVPPATEANETAAESGEPMSVESGQADVGEPAIVEDVATPETLAPDAVTEEAVAQDKVVEEALVQDDTAAEQDRKYQQELAKTRAEAAAAKAEAAKARKEALKAEKALAEQRRLQEEERLAQELAEQEQVPCPYTRAQPLVCSSRQGQPAYCDWNFKACGMPRLLKKESKTTCDGKMRTDPENNQIVVVEGCRGKFIPEN